MEGTLSKWTNVMKGWQIRWFVLDEQAGLFSYYTVSSCLHDIILDWLRCWEINAICGWT